MIGMIQDISTMHDVLHESKTGLWIIEIEDGRQPRMFADQTMMGKRKHSGSFCLAELRSAR